MAKKKKLSNPFEGKEGAFNPKDLTPDEIRNDEEAIEEMMEDMRQMEKMLGPKKFKKLLSSAIEKSMEDPETRRQWEEWMAEAPAELTDPDEGDWDDEEEDWDDDDWSDDDDPVLKEEWERTHPANLKCRSDEYYADLGTDLADIVDSFPLPPNTPEGFCRELGRVLAAYLEDVVSGTKVFAAMRRVCRQRYGYTLPFYDCDHDEYMPDHINEEDIRFLIWATICRMGKELEKTYSPLAPGWDLLADRMFDELNSCFEEAPEATRVADWLRRSFRKGDYLDIREIATWLVMRNPLTCVRGYYDDLVAETAAYITQHDLDMDPQQLLYGAMAKEAWQRSMSAMGCPTHTLVAAMAEEFGKPELAKEIEAIEVLPLQVYKVTQERKSRRVVFEDSAHREYTVERESFAKGFRFDDAPYANCNLVRYQGKYLLNGLLSGSDELKEDWETEQPTMTFEQQKDEASKWIEKLEGRQVVCVSSINKFLKELGFPPNRAMDAPDAKNFVALISRELGLALLPDAGYAFDLPDNRFYRKKQAEKDSFAEWVFHNAIPHDVALYIQEHNLLPQAEIFASQGKEAGRRIVQDFLAFWIGFYCELPAYGGAQPSAGKPE